MKTRREVIKSGAAVVAAAALPVTAVAAARPTHHRFTFEVFVEGDIEAARRAFKFYQEQIVEGAHEELRGLRIGVNSSKVEPVG
jgi:hypothetical protein